MKILKRMLSMFLCCMMLVTMFAGMGITSSAASYAINYGAYPEPTVALTLKNPTMKGDYVKWFQCCINYLVQYGDKLTGKKMSTTYLLDVDGSFGPASEKATKAFQQQYSLSVDGAFGPASRAKMKEVLKINQPPVGALTSEDINVVLREVMQKQNPINTSTVYTNPVYWTAPSGSKYVSTCKNLAPRSTYAENKKVNNVTYASYSYGGASQCYGFADYVLARAIYKKTGKVRELSSGQSNPGWACAGYTKIAGSNVTELKVGDVIRVGKKGTTKDSHSAIVMTANNGVYTFAECWGGSGSLLKIGGGMETMSSNNTTLAQLRNNYSICWVIRYNGN